MGVSTSGDQLAAKFMRYANSIDTANREAVQQCALSMKELYASQLGKFAHLRNMGRRGVTVRARYDIKGTKNPTALIKAAPMGAATIAERGAQPHLIGIGGGKSTSSTRRFNRNRKYLEFPSGDVRLGPVAHPGMTGALPWARAKTVLKPKASELYRRAQRRKLVESFR